MSTATIHSEKKKALVPKLRFLGFAEEWENYSLKKLIVDLNSGISVNSDDFPIQNDLEVGILKTSCVANGIFKESENKKIVENEVSRAKLNPTKNEIIISRMNTPQLVGESGYIDRDYPSLFIPDRLWQTVVNQELCDSRWLSYFLITEKVRDNLKSIATGTSGTMKNISKPNFLSINVLIPTLPEQQKIASFLSAVDEKIQQLSRKKELLEQYKKGVMQQLFSGKLRFKDENGKDYPDWEEKKLGEVCEIIGGGTPDTNISEYWGGEIQWFTPTEIKSDFVYNSIRTITDLGLQKSSAKKLPIGTILLTTRATIGEVSISQKECSTNQGFQSLIVKEGNDNIFIFNWIKRNKHELIARANGSTFPEISKSAIEKISLNVPSLPEQQKIANFLSGIDGKIEQVNGELVKTQEFKKGLLQQMFV